MIRVLREKALRRQVWLEGVTTRHTRTLTVIHTHIHVWLHASTLMQIITHSHTHRYECCPAAASNHGRASCYRTPMTLLIPPWPGARSLPHITPINRPACQLNLLRLTPLSATFYFTQPNPLGFRPPSPCSMTPRALNPPFTPRRNLLSCTFLSPRPPHIPSYLFTQHLWSVFDISGQM